MDLSYPIFKLEQRAEYERECAASGGRLVLSGGSDQEAVYADDAETSRHKDGCSARAEACEEAARILKQHSGRHARG